MTLMQRAQGSLTGLLVGDALGSLVEFKRPKYIKEAFPKGVREIVGGGPWNTLPGQPTDDGELALTLGRSIVQQGGYDARHAFRAYQAWYDSRPFDIGMTTRLALAGEPDPTSEANGALMRVAPLGLVGNNFKAAADWARADAELTHPNEVCVEANAAFVVAINVLVHHGDKELAIKEALRVCHNRRVRKAIRSASDGKPPVGHNGWVLTALRGAFYHLAMGHSFEMALVETINRGGDTDTNAAITGALVGTAQGLHAIPTRWRRTVLNCRPNHGEHPRPEEYWPDQALKLAHDLLTLPQR